ncbi:MAG: hypothetical protein AAFU85_28640 [Planctomycetota bacterium]
MANKAKYDDLDTRQIFVIGISSIVVTLVTILAVQYVYFVLVNGHESKLQAQSSYSRQNKILDEQFQSVSGYGADPSTGNITIPITEAMAAIELEHREHASSDHTHDTETPSESDAATDET